MRRRYLVGGRVQGVGFRYFTQRTAVRLGLTGWVRNLPDGGVEVEAQGSREVLTSFESALRQGPRGAVVAHFEHFEVSDESDGGTGFLVR